MSLASSLPEVLPPSRQARPAAAHARLARAWLALAVGALATSGVLSLGVVAARIPALARYWTHTELAHRVLVVHVDLAVLVWFCSFPMVLLRWWAAATGRDAPAGAVRFAPWVASVGAAIARLRRLHASTFPGENLARIGFASAPESHHPAELSAMHPTRNRT